MFPPELLRALKNRVHNSAQAQYAVVYGYEQGGMQRGNIVVVTNECCSCSVMEVDTCVRKFFPEVDALNMVAFVVTRKLATNDFAVEDLSTEESIFLTNLSKLQPAAACFMLNWGACMCSSQQWRVSTWLRTYIYIYTQTDYIKYASLLGELKPFARRCLLEKLVASSIRVT